MSHKSTEKRRRQQQLKIHNDLLTEEKINTIAYYNSIINKNKNKIYDYKIKLRNNNNKTNKQTKEQITSLTYRNSLLECHVEHIKNNIPKRSVKFSSSRITFNQNSPPRNLTSKKKELLQSHKSSKHSKTVGKKTSLRHRDV